MFFTLIDIYAVYILCYLNKKGKYNIHRNNIQWTSQEKLLLKTYYFSHTLPVSSADQAVEIFLS